MNKEESKITCSLCGTDISEDYKEHKCNVFKKVIHGKYKMDLSIYISMLVVIILHEFNLMWFLIVYILLLEYIIDPMIRRLFK